VVSLSRPADYPFSRSVSRIDFCQRETLVKTRLVIRPRTFVFLNNDTNLRDLARKSKSSIRNLS